MIYGEALTFGRKRGFYVTRLKRIEVCGFIESRNEFGSS